MARAAEMAMVAYDDNALESQYLQGWLMQDRFLMRGGWGVYEFLWANPYQPGLSYFHMPLVFHEVATGHLFARTSWDKMRPGSATSTANSSCSPTVIYNRCARVRRANRCGSAMRCCLAP